MKKSFVLLLALVLLFFGTGIYTQAALLKEKDQVYFEETFSYGDKTAIEGVKVEMYNELESQLFWNTTYEVGVEPKVETEYEFYPWYHDYSNQYQEGVLDIVQDYSTDYFGSYIPERQYSGLDAAMKELYDMTEPGEQNKMTVYLKDYLEYYTFTYELRLPVEEGKRYTEYYRDYYIFPEEIEDRIAELEASNGNKEELEILRKCQKDIQNFQEFLKIPVLEKEAYTIALVKDKDGKIAGSALSGKDGASSVGDILFPNAPNITGLDSFFLDIDEVFDNGDCYFTFKPYTMAGKLVDTSQIPGGYGIYHFSYDSESGTIDSENIKMVYALTPGVDIVKLIVDASGKNLLLETEERGHTYLSIIDRKTLGLVDKFDMGVQYGLDIYSDKDFMVVSSDVYSVYEMDETGHYTKVFSVSQEATQAKLEEYEKGFSLSNSNLDWNGETLLVTQYLLGAGAVRLCGFSLAAIDETGLIYYGEYESSLITSKIESNDCRPAIWMKQPVIVQWGE